MARKTEEQKIAEARLKEQRELTDLTRQMLRGEKSIWETARPVKSVNPNLFITGKRANQSDYLAAMGGFYGKKSYEMFLKEFKKEQEAKKKAKPQKKKEDAEKKKLQDSEKKQQDKLIDITQEVANQVKEVAVITASSLSDEQKAQAKANLSLERERVKAEKAQQAFEKAEEQRAKEQERRDNTFFGQIRKNTEDLINGGAKNKILTTMTARMGKIGEMIDTANEFKLEEEKEKKARLKEEARQAKLDEINKRVFLGEFVENARQADKESLTELDRTLVKIVDSVDGNLSELEDSQVHLFNNLIKNQKQLDDDYLAKFGMTQRESLKDAHDQRAEYIKKLEKTHAFNTFQNWENIKGWATKEFNVFIDVQEKQDALFANIAERAMNSEAVNEDLRKLQERANKIGEEANKLKVNSINIQETQVDEVKKTNELTEEQTKTTVKAFSDQTKAMEEGNEIAKKNLDNTEQDRGQQKDIQKENFIQRVKDSKLMVKMNDARLAMAERSAKAQERMEKGINSLGDKIKGMNKGDDDSGLLGGIIGAILTRLGMTLLAALGPELAAIVAAVTAAGAAIASAIGMDGMFDGFGGEGKGSKTRKVKGPKPKGKIGWLKKAWNGTKKFGGKALKLGGKLAAPALAAYEGVTGYNEAEEMYGENATFEQKRVAAESKILSALTFGLLDRKSIADFVLPGQRLEDKDPKKYAQIQAAKKQKEVDEFNEEAKADAKEHLEENRQEGAEEERRKSRMISPDIKKAQEREQQQAMRDEINYQQRLMTPISERLPDNHTLKKLKVIGAPSTSNRLMTEADRKKLIPEGKVVTRSSKHYEATMGAGTLEELFGGKGKVNGNDNNSSTGSSSFKTIAEKIPVIGGLVSKVFGGEAKATVSDTQLNLEKTQLLVLEELKKSNELMTRLWETKKINDSKSKAKKRIEVQTAISEDLEMEKLDEKKEQEKSWWESAIDGVAGFFGFGSGSHSRGRGTGNGHKTFNSPQATGTPVKAMPSHNGGKGQATKSVGPNGGRVISYPNGDVKTGGTRNWRNNNPGNLEYGSFAKSHGAIGSDDRFAIFSSMEEGYAAQAALISGGKYTGLTLAQAIYRYAPPNENNTENYIGHIIRNVPGVTRDTIISDLPKSKIIEITKAMSSLEGAKVGTLTKGNASSSVQVGSNVPSESSEGTTKSSIPTSPTVSVNSSGGSGGSVAPSTTASVGSGLGGGGGSSYGVSPGASASPVGNPVGPASNGGNYSGKSLEGLKNDTRKKLDTLNGRVGGTFFIVSAYRSPSYNRKVGGAKGSMHMKGQAIDIRWPNNSQQAKEAFIKKARASGFNGIGIYPGFIHVDTGKVRAWGANGSKSSLPGWAAKVLNESPSTAGAVSGGMVADGSEASSALGGGQSSGASGGGIGADSKGSQTSVAFGSGSDSKGATSSSQGSMNGGMNSSMTSSLGSMASGALNSLGLPSGISGLLGSAVSQIGGSALSNLTNGNIGAGSIETLFGGGVGAMTALNRVTGARGRLNSSMRSMPSVISQGARQMMAPVEKNEQKSKVDNPFMAMVSGILLPDL